MTWLYIALFIRYAKPQLSSKWFSENISLKKYFAKLHSAVSFRIDVSKQKVKNDQGPANLGSSWPYIVIMEFTQFTQELSKMGGIESSRPPHHSSQLGRFLTYIKFDSMDPITRGLPNAPPFDAIVFVFWTIFQENEALLQWNKWEVVSCFITACRAPAVNPEWRQLQKFRINVSKIEELVNLLATSNIYKWFLKDRI